MSLIARYEKFIVTVEENQEALKTELAELSVSTTLTKEERKFMNDLMEFIGYGNSSISYAELVVNRLKREEKQKCLKEEA